VNASENSDGAVEWVNSARIRITFLVGNAMAESRSGKEQTIPSNFQHDLYRLSLYHRRQRQEDFACNRKVPGHHNFVHGLNVRNRFEPQKHVNITALFRQAVDHVRVCG
jgi:hypothetical protein